MTGDDQQPDLIQSWAAAYAAQVSPELTFKAACAAMDAAEKAAEGPHGCGVVVDRALRNLSDKNKTWQGATDALQALLDQAGSTQMSKSDQTRAMRVNVAQSALDAINREMSVSRAYGIQPNEGNQQGLVVSWADALSENPSPELTWRAVCAAMDAAEEVAKDLSGCSRIVDKTLRDLSDKDKTWKGAKVALRGLLEQVGSTQMSKSDATRATRVNVIQSALDALDREMKVSQALKVRS